MTNYTHFRERYLLYLATGILAICVIYFFAVTFITIPESGKQYADIVLDALIGSGFTALVSYFWGSSKGSQDKSDQIREDAKGDT